MNHHIGERIKERYEAMRRSNPAFTKAEFARRIHVHRSTVYHLFERSSIDTALLQRISAALEYDFCAEALGKSDDDSSRKIIVTIEMTMEQFSSLALPQELLTAQHAQQ